jgi:N-acetylneuraminic acid mutarotase
MLDGRIYIAGGQERMDEESSTGHFFMLDTREAMPAWVALPSWPGSTLGYAVCAAQAGKIWLFGGRSYGRGLETTPHDNGYSYDPQTNTWVALKGSFPFMAAANTTVGDKYIIFLGGVAEVLPTGPDHPGFTRKVHIFDTSTGLLDSLTTSPFPLPLTTNTVRTANGFYITSGEVRPGVRTPKITKGEFTEPNKK